METRTLREISGRTAWVSKKRPCREVNSTQRAGHTTDQRQVSSAFLSFFPGNPRREQDQPEACYLRVSLKPMFSQSEKNPASKRCNKKTMPCTTKCALGMTGIPNFTIFRCQVCSILKNCCGVCQEFWWQKWALDVISMLIYHQRAPRLLTSSLLIWML